MKDVSEKAEDNHEATQDDEKIILDDDDGFSLGDLFNDSKEGE